MVVVGAGVHPDTMLAERAGLEVDNGIVCDSKLETSVEGIFAAGRRVLLRQRRARPAAAGRALGRGAAAGPARGAAGCWARPEPYRVVPYFFSDLADWASLEYVGPAERWDEVVWRGDRDAGEFSAWYLDGGKVAAALVGRPLGGPGPRPAADRVRGGRVRRRRARWPTPTAIWRRSDPARLSRCGRTCRLQADYSNPAGAGWCNGNTPASGAGIRGSSPWPAAQRRSDVCPL